MHQRERDGRLINDHSFDGRVSARWPTCRNYTMRRGASRRRVGTSHPEEGSVETSKINFQVSLEGSCGSGIDSEALWTELGQSRTSRVGMSK